MSEGTKIYPIAQRPKVREIDGWSVDIVIISGKKERKGYYDPKGSISGGKYFYYKKDDIIDCALLAAFPTHWKYKNKVDENLHESKINN